MHFVCLLTLPCVVLYVLPSSFDEGGYFRYSNRSPETSNSKEYPIFNDMDPIKPNSYPL